MYTLIAIAILAIVIGFYNRKSLCVPKPKRNRGDFETPMGDFVTLSVIVFLLSILGMLLFSITPLNQKEKSRSSYDLVSVNNSLLNAVTDKHGYVYYSYVYIDADNSILSGKTDNFKLTDEKPHIVIVKYVSIAEGWLFPPAHDEDKIVYITKETLSNRCSITSAMVER